MASSSSSSSSTRKKQDEKNLKTLRELASTPENRYCFDCNQRGPTYVNITIGSFVCTKCSGLLRGLTPPQRVKSISMATFTQDEVDSMRKRGNYYCRRTWMALYDGIIPTDGIQDEQKIRDFMIDKYERKRYYVEPDMSTLKNGHNTNNVNSNNNNNNNNHQQQQLRSKLQTSNEFKQDIINNTSLTSSTTNSNKISLVTTNNNNKKLLSINGIGRPDNKNLINKNTKILLNGRNDFIADFAHADIFNAANNNNKNTNSNGAVASTNDVSFANFDNNPVFNNATKKSEFSIFDLKFTSCEGPILNSIPLFPKCSIINRWSLATTNTSSTIPQLPNNNIQSLNLNAKMSSQSILQIAQPAPLTEDKYAALKDLDNALKSQSQSSIIDWNSTNTNNTATTINNNHNTLSNNNGSIYGGSTPSSLNNSSNNTASFNSPMSQCSSMYGSPSQGQFPMLFQEQQQFSQSPPSQLSNPFNNMSTPSFWNSNETASQANNGTVINGGCTIANVNPFRTTMPLSQDIFKSNIISSNNNNNNNSNGFHHGQFQTAATDFHHINNGTILSNPWIVNNTTTSPNPFKIIGGTDTNGHSNNPFL